MCTKCMGAVVQLHLPNVQAARAIDVLGSLLRLPGLVFGPSFRTSGANNASACRTAVAGQH